MDLFIKNELPKVKITKEARELYKIAEEFRLDDDADKWQMQTASTLYEQAPYLNDYAVDVSLRKVDADKGYGFGSANIRNKVDDPKLNPQERHDIRVPIVINNKMLKPFDVLTVDGKAQPMSEQIIRQLLMRPENVELSTRDVSRDKYIGYQNQTPHASGFGGYGTGMTYDASSGIGKYASLLSELNIDTESKKKIASEVIKVRNTIEKNSAFLNCLDKIAHSKQEITMDPFVTIQLRKEAGKIYVKLANNAGQEQETVLSPEQAQQNGLPVQAIEEDGSITVSTNKAKKETLEDETYEVITEFGEYKVQDVDDNDLLGWVFPVMNFQGQQLPVWLFTNGSVWAFQEKIAGSKVGMGTNLPFNKPMGFGVFYSEDNGKATCSEPLQVSGASDTQFQVSQLDGTALSIEKLDIETMIPLSESQYAIPNSMKFMRLSDEQVTLKSNGPEIMKTAERKHYGTFVAIRKHAEDLYSIRGDFNKEELDKLAAEFYLTHLGYDNSKQILGGLDKNWTKQVKLAGCYISKIEKAAHYLDRGENGAYINKPNGFMESIGQKYDRYKRLSQFNKDRKDPNSQVSKNIQGAINESNKDLISFGMVGRKKTAGEFVALSWEDLVKIASTLQDEDTVDKILSIGLINPDNIHKFISYLPDFENVQHKLAELLLAARCGLTPVPEENTQLALGHITKLIEGLKNLKERETLSDPT